MRMYFKRMVEVEWITISSYSNLSQLISFLLWLHLTACTLASKHPFAAPSTGFSCKSKRAQHYQESVWAEENKGLRQDWQSTRLTITQSWFLWCLLPCRCFTSYISEWNSSFNYSNKAVSETESFHTAWQSFPPGEANESTLLKRALHFLIP